MFEQRLIAFLLRYRGWIFFACIAALAFSITGLRYFTFDDDSRNNFSQDDPFFLQYHELEDQYGGQVDAVVLVLAAKKGDIFSRSNLQTLADLTNWGWTLPYSKRVDSISNYQHTWVHEDELIVEALLEKPENLSNEEIATARDIITHESTLKKRLINEEGSISAVNIIFNLPAHTRKAREMELDALVSAKVQEIQANNPDLDIYLSGRVISNTEVAGQAYEDIKHIIPFMYLIIYGLLAFLLRSIVVVVGIYVLTMLSAAAALGLASWLGITISLLALTSINVIITVSMAHCVHILVNFLNLYRAGENKLDALQHSLGLNLRPIFLTSLTTAIGFLSMNFSEMPTAQDLGNITAIGVVVVFILSLGFLPPYLLLLPINRKANAGNRYAIAMDKVADFIVSRRVPVFVTVLIFSLLLLALAPLNNINDRFTETIKKPHPFRTAMDFIDQEFGGLYLFEYSLAADGPGGISDPLYLQKLNDFTQWLRQQEKVSNVQCYSDIIKRLNQNMHNDDPAYYRVPESRELAAQYLLLYEMSLPFGLDMGLTILPDKSATRVTVAFPTMDSQEVFHQQALIDQWLKANVPDYMYYPGAGMTITWAHLGGRAMISSIKGAFLALFIISAVLSLALRSFKYGVISLIPNLLPAGMGFGIWALFRGEVGMAHMTILGITIGIVVDDTVHFLSKYLHARKKGESAEDAVRFAFHNVGPALWITTLVLVAGFAMMSQSSFVPNSDLGLMAAIILVAALILDFLLLPPLLIFFDGGRKAAS